MHGIGIVGLGTVSGAYLDTLAGHPRIKIAAVADLDRARAEAAAHRLGCEALDVTGTLEHPGVETILNLTIPAAHAEIALAAIARGKQVFGEKPLAVSLEAGRQVLRAADEAGVWVGSAPDTVLGTGVQTARAAIDDGAIGRPVAATAAWISPGHEAWHPHPDFYYRDGGGPLLDMGPYYLTALVHLLGPVARVTGAASRTREERMIGSGPRAGERIPVEVATHTTGVLEHVNGSLSTVMLSFDGVGSRARPIEVHGEAGSLSVPDPNISDGDVEILKLGTIEWETLAPTAGYVEGSRGVGLLDFVAGHRRAAGDLALHVLEVMTALLQSSRERRHIEITSSPQRPSVVPLTPRREWAGVAE